MRELDQPYKARSRDPKLLSHLLRKNTGFTCSPMSKDGREHKTRRHEQGSKPTLLRNPEL